MNLDSGSRESEGKRRNSEICIPLHPWYICKASLFKNGLPQNGSNTLLFSFYFCIFVSVNFRIIDILPPFFDSIGEQLHVCELIKSLCIIRRHLPELGSEMFGPTIHLVLSKNWHIPTRSRQIAGHMY